MGSRGNRGRELCDLAARLGVGIGEACQRAEVDRTTLARWRRGGNPREDLASRVRLAIEAIAAERGTLPSARLEDREAVLERLHALDVRLARIEALLLRLVR